MNKENLNSKTWYRAVKVLFVLLFLLVQGLGFFITYSIVGNRVIYTLPVKGDERIVIYSNGTKVKFERNPTADDIKEVAQKYNFPTTGERILGKEQIIADIEAMEKQNASQWEVQEFLDSLAKPNNIAGFWADKTDTYTINRYSLSSKIFYLVLSFVIVSIMFWVIARVFFYIFLGENFWSKRFN